MMHETLRLKVIEDYKILDTLPEKEFDDITELAAFICVSLVALITLLDSKRQWFKSHHGIPMAESSREISFCDYAIQNPDELMEVNDLSKDERFKNNALVINEPHVRFYAGAPLVNSDGYAIGTLCVLDAKESKLSAEQKKALECLANNVIAQLELRQINLSTDKELKAVNRSICEDLHQKVFEMFYLVSEKSNGSGLGLYIVNETIQKLNGSISLQSQCGFGSKFSVTIYNLLNN